MPTYNGTQLTGVLFSTSDGTPIAMGSFEDTLTFTEDISENQENTIHFEPCRTVEFTAQMSPRSWKRLMNLFVYGWKNKGSLRKRMLHKAFRMSTPILLKRKMRAK